MSVRTRRAAALAALGALVAACCTVLGPAPVAGADTHDQKRKIDRKIHSVKDDLDDTSKALNHAYSRLKATRAKVAAAQTTLAEAQAELAAAQARFAELAQELAVAQAAQDRASDQLSATKADVRHTTDLLGSIARQTYQGSGLSTLSVAMSAQSPDDFATGMALADTAARIQDNALRELGVQRAEDAALTAKLTAARAEVAEVKAEAAAQVAVDKTLERQAADAKASLDRLAAQQKSDVNTVQARKKAEKHKLRALNHESRKLAKKLARLARKHHGGIYRSANGFLSYPARGPLSSPFGLRYHPILHYWRMHTGQDWAIACGTPVHAAAGGRIVSAGWAGGYGYRVVIDHGRVNGVDLATTYNHLSRIVRHGGHVKRGQLIAYSGTTGLSTGCHLHFETRQNGVPVNPTRWL